MGVDLLGDWDISLNWAGWKACLDAAVEFGWQPAGTHSPQWYTGEWSGSYCTNDFQEVSDADAQAFAKALFRAAAAIKAKEGLTDEQAKAIEGLSMRFISELAALALSGGFVIA